MSENARGRAGETAVAHRYHGMLGDPDADLRPRATLEQAISRRRFLGIATTALGLAAIGCPSADPVDDIPSAAPDRLLFRPRDPTRPSVPGLHPLGATNGRDGLFYVPRSLPPGRPAPLLVLLHGAGGSAANWFGAWTAHAEATGMVIAAPDSRDATWQMGTRGGGRDARFVDQLLAAVTDTVSIDAGRVALGGFSDGASYALTLGLVNGDVFQRIVAFSPGFILPGTQTGRPRLFVSHGTQDTILPIDRCSRLIVPMLRRSGYEVEYVEFEGGHRVPSEIRERALAWLAER